MITARIIGSGGYLPKKVISNDALTHVIDTSHEWIVERTGIQQRHIAGEGETTLHLAMKASFAALKDANITAADVDAVIVATVTPDQTFPATAVLLQNELGIKKGFAFDVSAACAGFTYALTVADNFIKSGMVRTILVVGAETFSRLLDWQDRRTCILFGDGAGAVVLTRHESPKDDPTPPGIIGSHLYSDGQMSHILYTNGGVSTTQTAGVVKMEGREVFRHAVTKLEGVTRRILEEYGYSPHDLAWLVPHQANKRIINTLGEKLGLREEQVIITVGQHANTSAASIPLALDAGLKDGRIKAGDLVLCESFGAGLASGANLIRW